MNTATNSIAQLNAALATSMLADRHGLRRKIREVADLQKAADSKSTEKADRLLAEIVRKISSSHQKYQARLNALPKPEYELDLPVTARREEIKAAQTSGIKNETVLQFVGGVSQKINCYENYMQLFGKEFISPISEFADKFYKFRGADTQYIKGVQVLHLLFVPLREGENVFNGDAWIDATTWAIKKINLNLSASADINFVNRLNITQEFEKMNDGKLIFSKDRITADLSPLPNDKLTFIVRKNISYKNFTVNYSPKANGNLELIKIIY